MRSVISSSSRAADAHVPAEAKIERARSGTHGRGSGRWVVSSADALVVQLPTVTSIQNPMDGGRYR
jgi:hypothetical protein